MVLDLWPGGLVPYTMPGDLPNRSRVEQAIEHWNGAGLPVRLLPRTSEADYVVFVAGDLCSSKRGRAGGAQQITLTPRCRVGVVLHEIGHAVGLMHEHNRPDRDTYIERIALENIYPEALSNFQARPQGDEEPGPYDFESVMHYSQMAFSRNRGPTIVPKPDKVPRDALIGQRLRLSDGDIARIKRLYPQKGTVSAPGSSRLSGTDHEGGTP